MGKNTWSSHPCAKCGWAGTWTPGYHAQSDLLPLRVGSSHRGPFHFLEMSAPCEMRSAVWTPIFKQKQWNQNRSLLPCCAAQSLLPLQCHSSRIICRIRVWTPQAERRPLTRAYVTPRTLGPLAAGVLWTTLPISLPAEQKEMFPYVPAHFHPPEINVTATSCHAFCHINIKFLSHSSLIHFCLFNSCVLTEEDGESA